MRNYELLVLVRPDFDDEKIASIIARYTDIIRNHGGVVTTAEKWAKRRLAYEINRVRDGIYLIFVFQGSAQLASELDRLLKIDQDVMRHMLCRIDHALKLEQKFSEKRARAQARRSESEAKEQAEAPEAAVVSDEASGETSSEN